MQTEVLQEFIVVANYSNFRKAAAELHITQPTLSNHIAALERELGFSLFDRKGGMRLTTAGAHFYTFAQHLLDELSRELEEARSLARENPPVKLQVFEKEDSVLNRIISKIETPFQMVPMDAMAPILASLSNGEADIVVAAYGPRLIELSSGDTNARLESLPIGKVELTFVVSSSNPLSKKDSLSRDDLRDQEILIPYGNSYDWGRAFATETLGQDFDLSFVEDPTLPMGPGRIPLRGLGQRIALNYKGAGHRACSYQSDLVAIDKLDGQPWSTMEYLIFRAEDPNPNVQAFVKEVRGLVGGVESVGDVGDAAKGAQGEERTETL